MLQKYQFKGRCNSTYKYDVLRLLKSSILAKSSGTKLLTMHEGVKYNGEDETNVAGHETLK